MKMTTWTLALSMATALGGVAVAQPDMQPQPPVGGGDMQPQPPQPQPPPPQPVANTNPAPTTPEPEAGGDRPDAIVFGIGAGFVLPGPLDTLTAYSVRVRLLTGITIEPGVVLSNSSPRTASTDDAVSTTTLAGKIGVRVPLITRGKFDFEILGDAAVSSVREPMGTDADTRTTDLALNWGIGVAWWITPHFQLTVNAGNPLVRFRRESNTTDDTTFSTKFLGVVFDPGGSVMLHVYN